MLNQLLLLYIINNFPYAALKIFYLSFSFSTLTVTCLSVDLFEFTLVEVHGASWMFFATVGNIWLLFLYILSAS